MQHFNSSTALRHGNGGSLDAAKLPFVVAPRDTDLPIAKGEFGFVVSDGATLIDNDRPPPRAVAVVVGDVGPANKFGEGSIAVHQVLAYGGTREAPPYDPNVCKSMTPAQCDAANLPYKKGVTFPYPYQDKRGGDVRPKRNWPSKLLYVFFPGQGERGPSEYTFEAVKDGSPKGTIVEGAEKAAGPFGGIGAIVACVRSHKQIGNFK
ncbi:hypothetical protein [Reyranella sp.]|uniref:hypothetical protein n=1 Tax=Reyranella sp. TaxID=1929291 RepID=UPI003D14047D